MHWISILLTHSVDFILFDSIWLHNLSFFEWITQHVISSYPIQPCLVLSCHALFCFVFFCFVFYCFFRCTAGRLLYHRPNCIQGTAQHRQGRFQYQFFWLSCQVRSDKRRELRGKGKRALLYSLWQLDDDYHYHIYFLYPVSPVTVTVAVAVAVCSLSLSRSGGVAGAEKGTLTFMVGASGKEFETLQVRQLAARTHRQRDRGADAQIDRQTDTRIHR